MKIKYADFLKKTSFNKTELIAFSWDNLIEDKPEEGCGILPARPMLIIDRILKLERQGNKGHMIAEQDIALDDWFFQCHFHKDPVQPGCLSLDTVWQMLGLYAVACGAKGSGRALGVKEVEFFGQIRPHNKIVRYDVKIKRYLQASELGAAYAIGSATVYADDKPIYKIHDAKAGIFKNIQLDISLQSERRFHFYLNTRFTFA